MRAIDADEHKRILTGWAEEMRSDETESGDAAAQVIEDCICQLDEAPAIDPVHAAGGCYCRECESWEKKSWHSPYEGTCLNAEMETTMDSFCSFGKMKEGHT